MSFFRLFGINLDSGQFQSVADTDSVSISTTNNATFDLSDQVANGTLAVSVVDGHGFIRCTQTTANITVTIPPPTATTKGKTITVSNLPSPTSTQSITFSSSNGDTVVLAVGQSVELTWSGTGWRRVAAAAAAAAAAGGGLTYAAPLVTAVSATSAAWGTSQDISATAPGLTISLPAIAAGDISPSLKNNVWRNAGANAFTVALTGGTVNSAIGLVMQPGSVWTFTAQTLTTATLTTTNAAQVAIAETGELTTITNGGTFGATAVDIPGTTFTIPTAGTWEVDYNLTGRNSIANFGVVALFTAAGAIVPGSQANNHTQNADPNQFVGNATIVTTGAATYKMRGVMNAGTFTVANDQNSFSTTSGSSRIWWKKTSTPQAVALTTNDRLWTVTANNAALLLGSTAVFAITNFSSTFAAGAAIATWDGTSIVVTAGAIPVRLEALIQTSGTGDWLSDFYFRNAADPINTRFGDGLVPNGVSTAGIYGQRSRNTPATAIVPANTTVTLNLVYTASGQNQFVNAGSYLRATEVYSTLVSTTPPVPPKVTTFTASGTFTRDPASRYAIVEMVGAGGAGGYAFGQAGANTAYVGLGGGSGAYVKVLHTAAQLGTTQAVTIGAGSLGNGGATSLGTLATANGGQSGGGRYVNSASTGLTSAVLGTQAMVRATFSIATGIDLGSHLGNLPSPAWVSSAPGVCCVETSNGADSAMGKGAIGLKIVNNPSTLAAPGGFNAVAAAANSGGGGSGDSTYSPNGTPGNATSSGSGGSGLLRVTEYYT